MVCREHIDKEADEEAEGREEDEVVGEGEVEAYITGVAVTKYRIPEDIPLYDGYPVFFLLDDGGGFGCTNGKIIHGASNSVVRFVVVVDKDTAYGKYVFPGDSDPLNNCIVQVALYAYIYSIE